MPVEFQFERVGNPDAQAEIERTVLEALSGCDQQWKVIAVGFISIHAVLIDILGPGVRWSEFYPVDADMLGNMKRDFDKLTTYYRDQPLSGESFQATFEDVPAATQ